MTEHKDVAIELAMGDTRVIWTANKPWVTSRTSSAVRCTARHGQEKRRTST